VKQDEKNAPEMTREGTGNQSPMAVTAERKTERVEESRN